MSEETATPTAIAEEPAKDVLIPEDEDIRVYPQTDPEPEPEKEAPAPEPVKEVVPDYLDPLFLKGGRTVDEALKEQAKAYREARTEMSRKQNEAAESRRLIDEHILKSINKPAPEQIKESIFKRDLGLDETQVRDDILRTVAPIVKPIVDEVVKLRDTVKRYEVEDTLSEDHWKVVQSEDFRRYAVDNFPQSMLQLGEQNPEVANFIVDSFKKTRQTPVAATPKPEPRVYTESAKVPVGAKVFSRRELIKLQQTNPSEYARMAPEIQRAYTEGNIRD